MYSNLKTYIILFIGVFALSTSAIFVKIADAPAPIIAFYRLLTAGVVLLPFFLCSRSCRAEFKALQPKQWGKSWRRAFVWPSTMSCGLSR